MVQGVQFRRGTTAQHAVFTGQPGEITVQVVTGTADGAWTKMEIFKIN